MNYLLKRLFKYLKLFQLFLFSEGLLIINSWKKLCIGRGTRIYLSKKGKLTFKGSFEARDLCRIKVTSGELVVGENVFINNFTSITCYKKIVIGDQSLIGEGVKIYDHDHIFNHPSNINECGMKEKEVHIGSNVWIGSNVVILKGTTIGNNSVIGAGCIVSGVIPEGSLCVPERNKNILPITIKS